MPLRTTTIGAFPKPAYLSTRGWFNDAETPLEPAADRVEELDRATTEVVRAQTELGIDVPTDGEIRRENYVHYHLRHLDGIDFDHLTRRTVRNGAWTADLPTVVGAIRAREHFLPRDWSVAQAATDRPVKMTVPGPLTIMDTTADGHYGDERAWGFDVARALNAEVLALIEAGCRVVQVDEPVFARYPERALGLGFNLLEEVLAGVPTSVERVLHVCCGYPDRLDSTTYEKADPGVYLRLAPAIEEASIDTVSLEDAHRRNAQELFEALGSTRVILGVVDVASSRVETAAEILERAAEVAAAVGEDRLTLGPDCGLALLPIELATAKLTAMVNAARAR